MYHQEAVICLQNENKTKQNKKDKQESLASGSRAMHGIFHCSTIQAIPSLTPQHK